MFLDTVQKYLKSKTDRFKNVIILPDRRVQFSELIHARKYSLTKEKKFKGNKFSVETKLELASPLFMLKALRIVKRAQWVNMLETYF